MPSSNSLIEAAGSPRLYLLRDGMKYYIQSAGWIAKNGYSGQPVHILQPSALAAIPSAYDLSDQSPVPGTPEALEGKLLKAHDKVYVVVHGVRHWVLNVKWLAPNGYVFQAPLPVSDAELQALPSGSNLDYTPPEYTVKILLLTLSLFVFLFISAGDYHGRLLNSKLRRLTQNQLLQRWTIWHTRTLLLLFFTAAIIAREPTLVWHPRFWAEEGTVWFQYACSHSFLKTISFVNSSSSYLALTANIGAVLSSATAARIGLEYAPAATTLLALLIQVLPIAVILFGKSRLFDSFWKRVAGCLIILFASTSTDEIWLNSINAMSFLGLISLLLLFEQTWNWPGWMRWASRGVLTLCGLSSPYACALLPIFVFSAWKERRREQKIQCLILIFCSLVQAGFVERTRVHLARHAVGHALATPTSGLWARGSDLRMDTGTIDVFFGHIALPVLGSSGQEALLGTMGLKDAWLASSSFPPRPSSDTLQAGGWLCLTLIAAILWVLKGAVLGGLTNRVIGAFLIWAVFTCLASLYEVPLGRYAFLPGFTFLLLLLVNIDSSGSLVVRVVSALLLAYGLANGIMSYNLPQYQSGPSWSQEVRIWRTDHTHPLRVWPPGWEFVYRPPENH